MITADTTVDIDSTIHKFFFVTTDIMNTGEDYIFIPDMFLQDNGSTISNFPNLTGNSYINLYINSVLQMNDVFTYLPPDFISITVPLGSSPVLIGTPIIIEMVTIDSDGTTTTIES